MGSFFNSYKDNPSKNWDGMIVGLNLLISSIVERYCFRFGATLIRLDQGTIETYMKELIFPEIESNDTT
jgi:hypothetical protein